MTIINLIEMVEQSPTCGSDCVCNADKFMLVSYMGSQVTEYFSGHV